MSLCDALVDENTFQAGTRRRVGQSRISRPFSPVGGYWKSGVVSGFGWRRCRAALPALQDVRDGRAFTGKGQRESERQWLRYREA